MALPSTSSGARIEPVPANTPRSASDSNSASIPSAAAVVSSEPNSPLMRRLLATARTAVATVAKLGRLGFDRPYSSWILRILMPASVSSA